MKGRRHTQPKPVASGSIFFSCLHPLAIVNDHPLHSSLSLIHLKSILQVDFSMKSNVSFSPSCTNQGRCISENSSLDVGCSFPFCFSVLTFHYRNIIYSLFLPRVALVRRVLKITCQLACVTYTRCDNGPSAFYFCCCVSSFLVQGPILLSSRRRQ